MGYTTDFSGVFKLDRELDEDTYKYLCRFSETRRMKFDSSGNDKYGIDGEYYVGHHEDFEGGAMFGQVDDSYPGLVEYNRPPASQPSLWCQWTPTSDRRGIEWDGGEKFYCYVEWIEYIIKHFLAPKGYKLNGEVEWGGEEQGDVGKIVVVDNDVSVKCGRIVY